MIGRRHSRVVPVRPVFALASDRRLDDALAGCSLGRGSYNKLQELLELPSSAETAGWSKSFEGKMPSGESIAPSLVNEERCCVESVEPNGSAVPWVSVPAL